jgi:pimeloyl-ACP methyl ester carboxylesterase
MRRNCLPGPVEGLDPFLVQTARAVLQAANIDQFYLVGHSMGGLTALLLAHEEPERVLSFVDIEGNVAPEDCFLSRQVVMHPADDAERFFDEFIECARRSPFFSSALYAANLRVKVRPGAVRGIFESMVELSDQGDLMEKFLSLPCPRMFMYGEQNASLSYLPTLAANGVELAAIPKSGHFPMYSNPVAMWQQIARFQTQSDAS